MGDQSCRTRSNECDNGGRERSETLLQRRQRVLGARLLRYVDSTPKVTISRDKRRGQVLQAQRAHRQRFSDYILELENEILRLRGSAVVQNTINKDDENQLRHQAIPKASTAVGVLIRCLNGQIGPGLFLNMRSPQLLDDAGQFTQTALTESTWSSFSSSLLPEFEPPLSLFQQTTQPHIPIWSCLETFDSLTRMLLQNFSENIAPTMVPVDGPSNGYRAILLPLAHEEELVRWALLASSANQLRYKYPGFMSMAVRYQDLAINRLSKDSAPNHSAGSKILAAIVLLLINGMMNGSADYRILLEMAKSYVNAICRFEPSPKRHIECILDKFLFEQVDMIEFYAQPLIQGQQMICCKNMVVIPSEDRCTTSNMYEVFCSLENAIKQACIIYSYHISHNGPPRKIGDMLETLKMTVLRIPSHTPGESSLAWVYFIAAAESFSVDMRLFFTKRLMGIYERGSFSDITTAFSVLHQIWNFQVTGEGWAKALMKIPLVFR